MADTKISALSAIADANITATDIGVIVDDLSGTATTYKVAMSQLRTALLTASVGSGWTATDYLGLGAGTIPSTGMIRVGQGSLTGSSSPLINSTATWNNAATTFTHILVNITDTTSNAASLLMDLQVASASVFKVTKGGAVTATGLIATSVTGETFQATGTTTSARAMRVANTTGDFYFGVESSSGGSFFTGATAYASVLYSSSTNPIEAIVNGTKRLSVTTSGVDVVGTLTATAMTATAVPASGITGTTLANNVVTTSITGLGTIVTGTWNGTAVALGYGGTGFTTYTAGDLIYASATNTLAKRAIGTDGYVLTVSGGVPTWAAFSASSTFTTLIQTTLVTEQLRLRYDASNYLSVTVSNIGEVTFNASFDGLLQAAGVTIAAWGTGAFSLGTNVKLMTAAGGLNMPTSSNSTTTGDFWFDGSVLKFRLAGLTKTLTWS